MAEASKVAETTAAQSVAALAPEAFAHAEKLRRDADAAYDAGDLAGANILSERAMAAYQHALVLGRVAYATDTANRARVALRTAEQAFAQSDGEQRRVAAQADDLEVRIKVIKEAVPLVSAGPADAAREGARLSSARSLALDAKLLCAATQMLSPTTPSLASAKVALDDLEKRLSTETRPAPIEPAMRARAQCLAALTSARRPATVDSSLGRSDQLLSELSAMGGLQPTRDDRGVVVTLRGLFSANQLTTEARTTLASLGRVGVAHPEFPIAGGGPRFSRQGGSREDTAADQKRGAIVAKALSEGGVPAERIAVEAAGSAHPVVDLTTSRETTRNERIEIIFVDPGG